jgi:archaellum component FlaC
LLHFRAAYKYSEPFRLQFKILGLPVYDNHREEKVKKSKVEKETASVYNNEKYDDEEPEYEELVIPENKDIINTKVFTETDENNIEDEEIGSTSKISGGFNKKINKIKLTFKRICDTIKDVRDNVEYYVRLANLESTKEAFRLCKKQVFKLLKLLCPRKYRVNLHLGFEDPATMGEALAIWGMLYPWHEGKIDIKPEFETTVMEGDFGIKGHICIISVIKAACIIYFNKNIRLLLRRLKRKTN